MDGEKSQLLHCQHLESVDVFDLFQTEGQQSSSRGSIIVCTFEKCTAHEHTCLVPHILSNYFDLM